MIHPRDCNTTHINTHFTKNNTLTSQGTTQTLTLHTTYIVGHNKTNALAFHKFQLFT